MKFDSQNSVTKCSTANLGLDKIGIFLLSAGRLSTTRAMEAWASTITSTFSANSRMPVETILSCVRPSPEITASNAPSQSFFVRLISLDFF